MRDNNDIKRNDRRSGKKKILIVGVSGRGNERGIEVKAD